MFKLSFKRFAVLLTITVLMLILGQSFAKFSPLQQSAQALLNLPVTVATATAPPQLVSARLHGKPVTVLYVTRSEDTVLVRCYPGYLPSITIQAMGGSTSTPSASQEGVMTCKAAA